MPRHFWQPTCSRTQRTRTILVDPDWTTKSVCICFVFLCTLLPLDSLFIQLRIVILLLLGGRSFSFFGSSILCISVRTRPNNIPTFKCKWRRAAHLFVFVLPTPAGVSDDDDVLMQTHDRTIYCCDGIQTNANTLALTHREMAVHLFAYIWILRRFYSLFAFFVVAKWFLRKNTIEMKNNTVFLPLFQSFQHSVRVRMVGFRDSSTWFTHARTHTPLRATCTSLLFRIGTSEHVRER